MTTEKDFIGVNPELIRPILPEEQQQRGWQLTLDGKVVPDVSHLTLRNARMGLEVHYGKREGYDGVLIHEPGGAGSVPIPFVIWKRQLWIGLVKELRKNMGGMVLDAPGGFLDPGETHFGTAKREFEEEVGVAQMQILITALGEPANPNRAWFDTSREEEGAHFYPIEFQSRHVERGVPEPEDEVPFLRFKEGVIKPVEGARAAEKIYGCRFYRWTVAAQKSDLFANAMFSRLLVYLFMARRADVSFF